jgi:hypothetical protein
LSAQENGDPTCPAVNELRMVTTSALKEEGERGSSQHLRLSRGRGSTQEEKGLLESGDDEEEHDCDHHDGVGIQELEVKVMMSS